MRVQRRERSFYQFLILFLLLQLFYRDQILDYVRLTWYTLQEIRELLEGIKRNTSY